MKPRRYRPHPQPPLRRRGAVKLNTSECLIKIDKFYSHNSEMYYSKKIWKMNYQINLQLYFREYF